MFAKHRKLARFRFHRCVVHVGRINWYHEIDAIHALQDSENLEKCP